MDIEAYNKTKGISCILLSAFCFAVMNLCVKMAGELPTIQKCLFRNFISFFVAVVVIKKENVPISNTKSNNGLLVLRSVFGLLGVLCNFYAIDHMALSDANALNKLSPFFTLIFSAVLLKEKVTLKQWGMVLLAFIGSLLVLKPFTNSTVSYASLIALCGGAAAGLAYTIIRKLSSRGINRWVIVGFFSAVSLIVMLPLTIRSFVAKKTTQLLWLIAAGMFATGGQLGVTTAYYYAPAREISVFDFSQILFSALLGYMFLNQVADTFSYIGYLIIIISAILDTVARNKR